MDLSGVVDWRLKGYDKEILIIIMAIVITIMFMAIVITVIIMATIMAVYEIYKKNRRFLTGKRPLVEQFETLPPSPSLQRHSSLDISMFSTADSSLV